MLSRPDRESRATMTASRFVVMVSLILALFSAPRAGDAQERPKVPRVGYVNQSLNPCGTACYSCVLAQRVEQHRTSQWSGRGARWVSVQIVGIGDSFLNDAP